MSKKEIYVSGRLTEDIKFLEIDDAPFLMRVLETFQGKDLEIRISQFYAQRSAKQNRYLWGVMIPMIVSFHKETQGEVITPDQVYTYLLVNVAEYKMITKEVFGELVVVMEGKSTSTMTTIEFMDFVKKVQAHFDKKGLEIPDPKNNNFLNDYL